MLTLHVYDVKAGDHALIRIEDGDFTWHAVVDCFCRVGERPAALRQLERWDVKHLDLLVLTHPHADHVVGLDEVARCYTEGGRTLGRWMDFGLDLRAVADQRFCRGSRAHGSMIALDSLLHARRAAGEPGAPSYTPLTGPRLGLRIGACATIDVLAPGKEAWLEQQELLERGERVNPNRISSALVVRHHGAAVLLAGDAEGRLWAEVLTDRGANLAMDIVKVGHHGGEDANPALLWGHLARPDRATRAVLSTAGTRRQPSPMALGRIVDAGAVPACTRFGPVCKQYFPRSSAVERLAAAGIVPSGDLGRRGLSALRARPHPRNICFGDVTATAQAAAVSIQGSVTGARCHLAQQSHRPSAS